MPLLFAYGTLQRDDVQVSTFGRTLHGVEDELPGFERSFVPANDPRAALTGVTQYANVTFTGHRESRVPGVVLEIAEAELAMGDEYERGAGYARVPAILVSGKHAWVYAHVGTGAPRDTIAVVRTELTANVSRALIVALNVELSEAYPEPGANHFHLDAEQVAEGQGGFFVVYHGGTPVGCGALRRIDEEVAELKRMYVVPGMRGRGVGRRLVAALEAEARSMPVRRLVLETGVRQHAALALYQATGFTSIPLFGEYLLSPDTSVCLGKELFTRPGPAA